MQKKLSHNIFYVLASLAFVFIVTGLISIRANAEEIGDGQNLVSYCWEINLLDKPYTSYPENVYYAVYSDVDEAKPSDSEDDEMPMLTENSFDNIKKKATKSTNGCFYFYFSEDELIEGKKLRVVCSEVNYLFNRDYGIVGELDLTLDYEAFRNKKGGVAADGSTYTAIDRFYSTSTDVSVDEKGIATWESAYPLYNEFVVAVFSIENNSTGYLDDIKKYIYGEETIGITSGLTVLRNENNETFSVYYERSTADSTGFLKRDPITGEYSFDCSGVIFNRFNNQSARYFIAVFSRDIENGNIVVGNQAGTNYYYVKRDKWLGSSASLDGYFVQYFYMDLSDEAQAAEDFHMEFYVDGKLQYGSYEGYDSYNKQWRFLCNVPMTKLDKPIDAYVVYNGKSINVAKVTPKMYLDMVISRYKDDRNHEKDMNVINSLLNYAGYAQIYFNNGGEKLLNDGIYTEENDPVKSISAEEIFDAINVGVSGTTENDDMVFAGVSLICKTDTGVKLYFRPKNGKTARDLYEKYKYPICSTCGDKELTTGYTSDGYFYVRMEGTSASYLSECAAKFTIGTDWEHTFQIDVYPIVYVKLAMKNNDKKLVDMCKALYLYNRASIAYYDN